VKNLRGLLRRARALSPSQALPGRPDAWDEEFLWMTREEMRREIERLEAGGNAPPGDEHLTRGQMIAEIERLEADLDAGGVTP
jgi:hypothetical protein